jgi:hypothetical protein
LLREKSFDKFIFVEDGIPTTSLSGKGNRNSVVSRNSEFVYGDDDDEMESAVASAQDQREEELQVIKLYKKFNMYNKLHYNIYFINSSGVLVIYCGHVNES